MLIIYYMLQLLESSFTIFLLLKCGYSTKYRLWFEWSATGKNSMLFTSFYYKWVISNIFLPMYFYSSKAVNLPFTFRMFEVPLRNWEANVLFPEAFCPYNITILLLCSSWSSFLVFSISRITFSKSSYLFFAYFSFGMTSFIKLICCSFEK